CNTGRLFRSTATLGSEEGSAAADAVSSAQESPIFHALGGRPRGTPLDRAGTVNLRQVPFEADLSRYQGRSPSLTHHYARIGMSSVDLFEYQARDIFESYGVPVLAGLIADTPEEAKAAAEKIGGTVVVKAQVKVGGRGKAGGVKVVHNADDAYAAAEQILG